MLHLLRLCPFLCGGHRQLALQPLAWRHQLAVYKRRASRSRLHRSARLFWAGLSRLGTEWRDTLVIVTPDTVLRWHRHRFRTHWTKRSGRPPLGRPPINAEIKALVTRMTPCDGYYFGDSGDGWLANTRETRSADRATAMNASPENWTSHRGLRRGP